MNINGTSINGIYKFVSTALYEKGDFVIDNSSIYVCKQNKADLDKGYWDNFVVTNSSYFSPYPNDFITLEEYDSKVTDNDESLKNKYISSEVLAKILQNHFYYGLVDGKLKKIEDFSEFNVAEESEDSRPSGVKMLDTIATNYDTSIFQLDSALISEIFGYYEDGEGYYTLISKKFTEEDSVYLFQIVFSDNKVAQQIINASNGFQAIRISDDTRTNFKNWYSISPNAVDILDAKDNIQKSLNDKYNKLENLKTTITNHFAFKSIGNSNTFQEIEDYYVLYRKEEDNDARKDGIPYIVFKDNKWVTNENRCFVNFILSKKNSETGIYYSKTLTVDLCDAVDNDYMLHYIDDSFNLLIAKVVTNNETYLNIGFTDSNTDLTSSYSDNFVSCDWKIKDIYYRDNI